MKTSIIIILIFGLMTLSNCTQQTDTGKLLDNTESRGDIFEAIANDHNHMMSFMETMQNNENAMQMMQDNQLIMRNMMKGGGMHMMMQDSMMMHNMMGNMMQGSGMHMMMKDTMMMHTMMGNMIKNKNLMGNMFQMMNDEGLITNECKQAMMNMMRDKEPDNKN